MDGSHAQTRGDKMRMWKTVGIMCTISIKVISNQNQKLITNYLLEGINEFKIFLIILFYLYYLWFYSSHKSNTKTLQKIYKDEVYAESSDYRLRNGCRKICLVMTFGGKDFSKCHKWISREKQSYCKTNMVQPSGNQSCKPTCPNPVVTIIANL